MLVLTRRVGEKVVVEHDSELLEIEVQQMGGGQVKLGFVGPRRFRVQRIELRERIRADVARRRRRDGPDDDSTDGATSDAA